MFKIEEADVAWKSSEARKAYNAAYQAAHREELRAKRAVYRAAHREEEAAQQAAWRTANRDRLNAQHAAWRAAHPEKRAAYYAAHPERDQARSKVNQEIIAGRMPGPKTLTCACGAPAREYHHHNGYGPSHELDVIAVCKACHVAAHAKT